MLGLRSVVAALLLLVLTCTGSAVTIHVPGEQLTIQAGIDAAAAGDTVEVACGIYYEHDVVMKSGVILRSESGEADCVTIDAARQSRVFLCEDLDAATTIEGLTITRGWATGEYPENNGGGMLCYNASPNLTNLAFVENQADSRGGGLACRYESHPTLAGVLFLANGADYGGGMDCWEGPEPSLSNVTFVRNVAVFGGGVCCYDSSPAMGNLTFASNYANAGGGLYCSHWATPTITNTVIAFSERGRAIHCFGRGIPDVSHSIIYENAGGDTLCADIGDNLIDDPLFCNIFEDDVTLCSNSPCLPGNNDWGELVGAFEAGCGSCDSPVDNTSWGTIKALFR